MTRLLRNPRIVAPLLGIGALLIAALLVPLPTPREIQDWAGTVGPAFPLLFFGAYALLTMAPIPRTMFTVSCGVLFGPWVGLAVAISATTVSAALAFLGVRALDRDRIASRLTHPAVRAIKDRLRRRGWLAVGSLRMIPIAPFSVVNYCCALSPVKFWPYLIATVAGTLPGTIATVVLADALTGGAHPAMFAVSAVSLTIGVIGLIVDNRWQTTPVTDEVIPPPSPVSALDSPAELEAAPR